MAQAESPSRDTGFVAGGPPLVGRRNLPRASHACQRCRMKKEKCNQQHPCSNCVKHASSCIYGVRRRNGRSAIHGAERSEVQDRHRRPTTPETRHNTGSRLQDLAGNGSLEANLSPLQGHGSTHIGIKRSISFRASW